jgi:hypothetical protein
MFTLTENQPIDPADSPERGKLEMRRVISESRPVLLLTYILAAFMAGVFAAVIGCIQILQSIPPEAFSQFPAAAVGNQVTPPQSKP